MSNLEAAIERGRIALKSDDATLGTVAKAMVDADVADAPLAPEAQPFPDLPKRVELTDKVRRAMNALPKLFGAVQPELRRTLSDRELNDLYFEREAIRTVTTALSGRDDAIKETVRNHMDADAEERGVAVPKAQVDKKTGEVIVPATPRDSHGHYVLATPEKREEVPIPGTNQMFVREYRRPSVSVDLSALLKMYEDGEITREEFLGMTRETRVLDEGKVWNFVRRYPERGLELLGKITKHGAPGTNFNVRKAS